MDKLVIDIETKNTFAEVGRDNFDALEVSLVGLYSYKQDRFFHFLENEMEKLGEILMSAEQIVGFSISRFDLPVLQKYFSAKGGSASGGNFDLFSIPRFDILDEIEFLLGRRVGLDILAKANLGFGKNGHSLEASGLYRDGKIEELKNYCLNDVKITKELYELIQKQGYLLIPQWNNHEATRLEMKFSDYVI